MLFYIKETLGSDNQNLEFVRLEKLKDLKFKTLKSLRLHQLLMFLMNNVYLYHYVFFRRWQIKYLIPYKLCSNRTSSEQEVNRIQYHSHPRKLSHWSKKCDESFVF